MKNVLKYVSCAGLLALASSPHAASIITANNSYVEGYLTVTDTYGSSISDGGASFSGPYDREFLDSAGWFFDDYSFPTQYDSFGNPIANNSFGTGGGDQQSIYNNVGFDGINDTFDQFSGSGFAVADISDPTNDLSFIQASGQSLVDITFEISTGHTYTLTGDLFANSLGRAELLFNGNTASELDGAFSFSGYLAAGSYNLSVDALAYIDDSQRANSGFNYNLQLTAVPIPAAVWLFGSGLISLAGLVRRKKA